MLLNMPSDPDHTQRAPDAVPAVLITRPRAAADRLAQALGARAAPHRVVISPIMDIRVLPLPVAVDASDVLVLSSAHAVAALQKAGAIAGQRAFCVGDATARAARDAGLDAVSAAGDADALAALVAERLPPGPVLWLHGAHTRGGLVESLAKAGFDVSESVLYEQLETPLSKEAQALLAHPGCVVVPVYSPRSAALLARACHGAKAALDLVFISEAARAAWDGPMPQSVSVADRPDGDAMLLSVCCRVAVARLA
jgi:uroporphyrinogen-III synthase